MRRPTTPAPHFIVRHFREPDFSRASIRFAEAVSGELVRAADRARPRWQALAEEFKSAGMSLRADISKGRPLFNTPLVWQFAATWVDSMEWPVVRRYGNGLCVSLPASILTDLCEAGGLGTVEFFLADLCEPCLGRLGSNDHNLDYALYVNVPVWINLAVVPELRESFARQIRMMVFHETGHFRWFQNGLRSEYLAHARGVAALRSGPWPSERDRLAVLLQGEHPEAWHNEEIRGLVNETKGGARLVKRWGEKIAAVTFRSNCHSSTPSARLEYGEHA